MKAKLYTLKKGATLKQASDILYRREIRQVGSDKIYRSGPIAKNKVRVKGLKRRYGMDVVLYTAISPNIRNRNPERLAKLAIKSAGICKSGDDGISYLVGAKRAGIATPFLPEYERWICELLDARDLEEAREKARQMALPANGPRN